MPEVFTWCKELGSKETGGGGSEFLIHLSVDVYRQISIFGPNNSFALRKPSSQKSELLNTNKAGLFESSFFWEWSIWLAFHILKRTNLIST